MQQIKKLGDFEKYISSAGLGKIFSFAGYHFTVEPIRR